MRTPDQSLRQPSTDGVHQSESIRREMVPVVLTTAQEERRESSAQKTYRKLITTEASAEYRIHPVLYAEFKRVSLAKQ